MTQFLSRDGRPVLFLHDNPLTAMYNDGNPPAEIAEQILDQIAHANPTGSVIVMKIKGMWDSGAVAKTEEMAKETIARRRVDCIHCPARNCPKRKADFIELYPEMPTTVYEPGNEPQVDVIEIHIGTDPHNSRLN